jgi:hypothetical protein
LWDGLTASPAAKRLAISKKALNNWLALARAGNLATVGANRSPVGKTGSGAFPATQRIGCNEDGA